MADILEEVAKNVRSCTKCRLYKTAINAVPGEGSSHPAIVFIGEAPGRQEDETGRPFVGRAGNLLEKLLHKINYKREEVWIGNVIKHRPPGNRDPLPNEIASCQGYLTKQLEALSPKLIVTLGRFAMSYFYPDGKISRDRGCLFKVGNFNIYPVYHPAAALRNGKMYESLKEDFLRIPSILKKIEEGNVESAEKDAETDNNPDGQLSLL